MRGREERDEPAFDCCGTFLYVQGNATLESGRNVPPGQIGLEILEVFCLPLKSIVLCGGGVAVHFLHCAEGWSS